MEETLERTLRQLELRKLWLWGLSAILLTAQTLTVLALVVPQLRGLYVILPISPDSLLPVGIGLCGLTLLFNLYIFLRHLEAGRLTKQLFEARAHEDTLRSRVLELSTLFDIAGEAHLEADLDPLLETVTRRVCTSLEADRASIFLLDPATHEMRGRVTSGGEGEPVGNCRVQIGEGIAGWVAQSNEPLVLNDEETLRRFAAETKPGVAPATAMCVPLAASGRMIGVLALSRSEATRPYTAGDARLLSTFAHHVAAAVQRIEIACEIERQRASVERLTRETARSNRAKEIFLEAANEELRGPLTCILAYGEFLTHDDRSLEPEKRATFARILNEQARRLADVASQSALLLRLDAKDAALDAAPASLNDVLAATVNDARDAANSQGVSMVTRFAAGLPPVHLDSPRLRQGVKALLGKALQLSESGGQLSMVTAQKDGFLRAELIGTHMQITSQDLARAYDLGEEDGGTPNRSLLGLELGLHVLKRVVELHGGRVWVECTPARETHFGFEIPIDSVDSDGSQSAGRDGATNAGVVSVP